MRLRPVHRKLPNSSHPRLPWPPCCHLSVLYSNCRLLRDCEMSSFFSCRFPMDEMRVLSYLPKNELETLGGQLEACEELMWRTSSRADQLKVFSEFGASPCERPKVWSGSKVNPEIQTDGIRKCPSFGWNSPLSLSLKLQQVTTTLLPNLFPSRMLRHKKMCPQ